MNTESGPTGSGLRALYDLVVAAGGPFADGVLHLPPAVGTGHIQLMAPEPGLRLVVQQCSLRQPLTLKRPAEATQPERLLISFNAFGPTPAGRHQSSVQITTSDIGFTTTLPADTDLFTVGISIHKALLVSWLTPTDEPLPAILTTRQPVVSDTLLTPDIQRILSAFAQPHARPYLPQFFYRVRIQELLYWLLSELANRAAPSRLLHTDDVEKIYQVRSLLLASLSTPPSLKGLAEAVGLSEAKLNPLFRQVFGSSPFAFYQSARLDEAKRLLGHLSVSEVGYHLGFTNLSHFARLFEKHHQLTPKKYQATLHGHGQGFTDTTIFKAF